MKNHISIDTLPIANWQQCKKGNLQYLYKCDFFEVPGKFPPGFNKVFEEMFYQFDHIDMTLPRLLNQAAKYENKFAVTGDHVWKNKANSRLVEYNRQIKLHQNGKQNFNDQVSALSRWIKMSIDIYTMSTRIYHSHLDAFKTYCEHLERQKVNG